jgi:hypothetical protein
MPAPQVCLKDKMMGQKAFKDLLVLFANIVLLLLLVWVEGGNILLHKH